MVELSEGRTWVAAEALEADGWPDPGAWADDVFPVGRDATWGEAWRMRLALVTEATDTVWNK